MADPAVKDPEAKRSWDRPEGASFAQWMESRVARLATRKYDWNALKFQADYDPKYRRAQMRYVGFQSGAGVRYLAQYGQAYAPINNQELFYTFQGLTADGAHCVVAILPVSATFLPATFEPDAPVPPDGVPFPGYQEIDTAKIEAYYQAVASKLEQAPDGSLAPDLPATWCSVRLLATRTRPRRAA